MKALVLGGSGFLGRYLIKALLKDGHHVAALQNKTPIDDSVGMIEIHQGSLEGFKWESLESNLPDVIFHTARIGGTNKRSRKASAERNARSNQALLDWLQAIENPPMLVYVSGTLVYGSRGKEWTDESAKLSPTSFQREYFQAEIPILDALNNQNIKLIVVRPSWILGPGSWFKAFFLNPIKAAGNVPLYGKGDNYMSFVHVEDAAKMTIHIALNGSAGSVFNLYTAGPLLQMEFAASLSKQLKLPIRHIPGWWLRLRHGKAVWEAFRFSLKLTTIHDGFWDDYNPVYPDVESWVKTQL